MHFGLRFDLRNPAFANVEMADRYQAVLDMAEWADERGCVSFSFSEHHGSDDGYISSPLTMAAAVAARTENVPIGIAALIAPFHDPLRIAEDIAVVDLISNGRLSVIFAGGYVDSEFEMFGVDPTQRPAIIREMVETLRAAWTGEPFEFRGRTVRVTPKPARPGGPPIILGGSTDPAARRAARIADAFVPSDLSCWQTYRDACIEFGKDDPGPGLSSTAEVIVLAEDPEAAWPLIGPYFMHESNAYGKWKAMAGRNNDHYLEVNSVDELRSGNQYHILTPDEYAAHLKASGEPVARFHPMVGGIPPKLAWEHLHLFEESFL